MDEFKCNKYVNMIVVVYEEPSSMVNYVLNIENEGNKKNQYLECMMYLIMIKISYYIIDGKRECCSA